MWKAIWPIIKPAAIWLGGKLAMSGVKKVWKIITKKGHKGGDNMPDKTELEKLLRSLITLSVNIQEKKMETDEILYAIVTIGTRFQATFAELKAITEPELKELLMATLDNMIGSEEDALIGPGDAALLKVSIPIIGGAGFEQVSDLILKVLTDRLADAMIKDAA